MNSYSLKFGEQVSSIGNFKVHTIIPEKPNDLKFDSEIRAIDNFTIYTLKPQVIKNNKYKIVSDNSPLQTKKF